MHSCNQMVHSYFARYSPNRKILAKNARYLPFLSDICLYLPKSHNWGGKAAPRVKKIIYMQNGTVKATGSHSEMMSNDKDYKELYDQYVTKYF